MDLNSEARLRSDKLIYKRHREWSGLFSIDKLKLRDLITAEMLAHTARATSELEQKLEQEFKERRMAMRLMRERGDERDAANRRIRELETQLSAREEAPPPPPTPRREDG